MRGLKAGLFQPSKSPSYPSSQCRHDQDSKNRRLFPFIRLLLSALKDTSMKRNEQLLSLGLDLARRREALLAALQGDIASLERLTELHGEPAEQALDSNNETVASRLAEVESEELERVCDAMSRFESGIYGDCEGCNTPIPLARLEALPYATLCIGCQVKLEESGCKDWSALADHA